MANYKVGNLDVTISGVSKDAVSSLDEVIKQLDTLQGKLGIVGKGFSGVFNNLKSGAIRTTVTDLGDITRKTESVANSQQDLTDAIKGAQASANVYSTALVAVSKAQELVGAEFRRLKALLKAPAFTRLSYDVGYLSTEWKNLYTTMQRSNVADALTDGQFSAEAQNRLTRLTQEYLNKKRVIDETNEAFKRMAMTQQELTLYDYQQENASRRQRIAYLNLMLATGQAGEKTREYKQELRELTKEQEKADKVAGKSATGGLSKFINRIGRIALYRTIRRGLQLVTQTFTESIQAYAQVDDNINNMMSQLTSSTRIIQLSLGTMIFPILQAITPVVQQLSVGFANMANAINKSMALAKGETTYTKILTEATEDYADSLNKASGALFDFDKFRALSNKQDTASTFLSTEDVSALDEAESKYSGIYFFVSGIGDALASVLEIIETIGNSATFQTVMTVVGYTIGGLAKAAGWLIDILDKSGLLEPILGGILGYLTLMGATKLFTALSGSSLVKWLGSVVSLLKEDFLGTLKMVGTDLLKVMSSTKALAVGIGALSMSIMYFVQNFDELGSTAKWVVPLIAAVTATVIGLTTAMVAFYSAHLGVGAAIRAGLTAAAVSGAVALAVGTSVAKSMPKYANGASDIDGGSVFIAGEAGKTEMVYTGNNGKTNVANVQQMYQAEYMAVLQALKDYGAARGEMPQLQPASDTGIYQAASRGARKVGKTFGNV